MPTIKQLPVATSVNATDVLPISQGGTTKGLTVSQLLSSTQAALSLASGKLLGRVSPTAGGPEPVGIGAGLLIDSGALSATGGDHTTLPLSVALSGGDEVVMNSGGSPRRMAATALRGLFSAGPGVSITDGAISATAAAYTLPTATTSALGGVKVDGRSVLIDGSGVISTAAASYTLPPATASTLGGVKVDGRSVLVDGTGVISAVSSQYTLPAATTSTLGGVKVDGRSVLVDGTGMISAVAPTYTLPTATVSTLGGVKVDGRSVLVDGNGVLSSVASTIPLPIVLGASSAAPGPITAVGASFALQNGNIAATDVPGSPDSYDGLRSVLVLQSGSNVTQASALGGYALNRSVYVTGTGKNAGVAVWGESVADVDGAQSWGMALSVHDGHSSGSGAGRIVTNEIDVGINHAQTTAAGLKLSAAFSVQPGSADGYVVATSGSATDPAAARWVNGLYVRPGAAAVAIRLGVVAGVGGLGSMPLVFEAVDAGGVARVARVAADLNGSVVITAGGLALQGSGGQAFASFSPASGMTLPAVAATGVSSSQPLVLTGRDASNASNSLQVVADSGGNLQAKAAGYSWQTGGGLELLNVGTGGVRVPPSATANGSDSLLLLLTGRNAAGALSSVTVKADSAGNGVVTGADILFQITGAVRVNGAVLLTVNAVPASGGLLATSGVAGAAQAASTAQFETMMTAWLQSKATTPSATPGWWNNSGNPTYS